MKSELEIVDRQNAVIRLQSDIIDDLFRLLMQHTTVEDAGVNSIVNKINIAAELRADIPGAEL